MKNEKPIPEEWKRPTEHSMKRRAPWHDYRAPGAYMLTMAVEGRRPLLGRLVMEKLDHNAAENGRRGENRRLAESQTASERPVPGLNMARQKVKAHIALSPLGEAVLRDAILKIPAYYPQVEVWRVCIMPDHVHLIVRVREALPEGKSLGSVVNGLKIGCNRAWRGLFGHNAELGLGHNAAENGTRAENRTLAEPPVPCRIMAGQKQGKGKGNGKGLFEPGYNDRLLFDGEQLERWKHYLDDNPHRLALKHLRPDLFTVMHGRQIGRWNCQLVGNIFLLDIPDKVAVIVHRADSDELFAQKKAAWLACGERGGVIVSAAIAKREKEVMREAMERGYSLILLKENGFPELYKPSGEAFNACARGQLLQVSPWPYHTEERTISREQCLELNRLAEEIAAVFVT